ncbi:MAG: hypothetical protein ACLRWP_15245 [Bilophila wadsworthia]
MSAYAEICSMFEQRRKVEEEYASAAYSQLLTFVELFVYIGCQQPDLVSAHRRMLQPLPDQTAPFHIVDNKMMPPFVSARRTRTTAHGSPSASSPSRWWNVSWKSAMELTASSSST